jgi:hygromycin-B 4-O-kinase
MSKAEGVDIDTAKAKVFLMGQLNMEASNVALIGEGAWSRCFGFLQGDEDLVIRFGNFVDDFRKDQLAHAYDAPDLPIPEVLEIGDAFDGYYAISARAHGAPLEYLSPTQWRTVVPSVVSALDAMRVADLPLNSSVGGWGVDGKAAHVSWSASLLNVENDDPNHRTHGWRERLAASPQGDGDFLWGLNLLKDVIDDSTPISLLHCDFINRNVLVKEDRISGVLDWGCSRYGDHLYDLAWFEFWAPWHTNLDVVYLRSEVEQRWREVGYSPENKEARLMTCYLHIGLDHLAYNAYLGDWATLAATAARMRTLIEAS